MVAFWPDARCVCFCEPTMRITPGNQLGPDPDAGLSSESSNSIVERAAESVDVVRDSDRQRRLSKVTPSPRRWRVSVYLPLCAPSGAVGSRGGVRPSLSTLSQQDG